MTHFEKTRGGQTLYEQLADWLQQQVEAGVYRTGDRLPSTRQLCRQHHLSLSTVKQAFRVLEDRGVARAKPQAGHFVRENRRVARLSFPEPVADTQAVAVRTNPALRLNVSINSSNAPTLGAAVQGAELMPTSALNRLYSQALRMHTRRCHSYDAPPGVDVLRREIARRGADSGYSVSPDDIVIASGAKEAVYLSIRCVTRPGDIVAIESPTYYALLEVLESLDLRAAEIASDPAEGISLEHLEHVLGKHGVAACALVSNFSNPTGALMRDEKKRRLVELLARFDVPLIEDDVYGDLPFHGERPCAVKAFDTRGLVLYCGSFSKTLSPGLRLGWAIPGRWREQFELLKLVVNQTTAVAPQLVAASFLASGGYDRHVRTIRKQYRQQMEAAQESVFRHFPNEVSVNEPRGGHVLWVELPRSVDSIRLQERALERQIRIAPGPMFSASGGFRNFIRLNTGFPWTSTLDEQMRVLGGLIAEESASDRQRPAS